MNKIDHIGIAVHSIEASIPLYRDVFGLNFLGVEEVSSEFVRVAFFQIGESKIELLEPLHPDSAIAKFLQDKGEGIHHIAFGVNNIEKRIQEAQSQGIRMIHEIPKLGAHGALIAFLHPKSTGGVLIEYCEKKENSHE
jgi:methylmalonyl-CoA/ethylmalonyl-CoA epimerase